MKFSLSWLRDYLDFDADLDALTEAMTMAGLEVEHVEDPAAALGAFTVAHVLDAQPHPNADKLRVCKVATKDGEKQIVCGAPNARTGLVGVYAPLGTYIPGLDFALDKKPRAIRGVESHGMLCSAKELQAGEDHDGIVDLTGDWDVGAPAAEALGKTDPVIDFEVTPNRPDWLGVVGIARDLAACGLGKFSAPKVKAIAGSDPCRIAVEVDATSGCPAFYGRLVTGVKNGPSPDWLRQRLEAVGIGPKSLLVDVTNYLSIDRARPLHVYDAAKLTGTVRARAGKAGERFLALDGKDYAVDETMCVIADDAAVLGLGGVMGGEASGVTEETTDVFIESAWFDPDRIARTGRATGIVSDAQYRFARGVDVASLRPGLDLATALIMKYGGGKPSEPVLAGAPPAANAPIAFDTSQVQRLTGLALRKPKILSSLKKLGFDATGETDDGRAVITVPGWRPDVAQSADLVEEVARATGYDQLPTQPLPRLEGRRAPAMGKTRRRVSLTRRALAARGLNEAVTWSFARADHAAAFGGAEAAKLANPISSELDVMRPSALIHLVLAGQKSADHGHPGAALFEVGPIYRGPKADDQVTTAAIARRVNDTRHWSGPSAPDVFTAKADALAALAAAGAPTDKLQVRTDTPGHWHPGRSGALTLGPKTVLAYFGELHPKALRALDVEGRVVAADVFLDAIPTPKSADKIAKPALEALDLMPVRRDFAFLVEADTPADTLTRAVAGADKTLITGVAVFDIFTGEGVEPGKKSVALEVTLQPRGDTLDDKALETVSTKIVAAAEKSAGATLRA